MHTEQDMTQIIDNLMSTGEVSLPSQDGWFAFKFPFQDGVPSDPQDSSWIFAPFFAGEDGEPDWDWIHDPALQDEATAFERARNAWRKQGCFCGVYYGQAYRFRKD